jgi:hypothetical protein
MEVFHFVQRDEPTSIMHNITFLSLLQHRNHDFFFIFDDQFILRVLTTKLFVNVSA